MNSGDRVKHPRYGTGTISCIWPKQNGLIIRFDCGYTAKCKETEVELLPKTDAA